MSANEVSYPATRKIDAVQRLAGHVLSDPFQWLEANTEEVAAWQRALKGDGQDVDKGAIEKKISNAKGRIQNAK